MKLDFFFPQKSSLLSFSDIWNFVCSIVFTADVIHFHYFDIMFSTEVSGFFISSFILLYSLNALFIETNSSWLIYESIKDFEIRASIVCNFLFSSNTILPWFFFIIELYLLIPAVIARIFVPAAEFVIPSGTQTNEANAEIVAVETKISQCSIT